MEDARLHLTETCPSWLRTPRVRFVSEVKRIGIPLETTAGNDGLLVGQGLEDGRDDFEGWSIVIFAQARIFLLQSVLVGVNLTFHLFIFGEL